MSIWVEVWSRPGHPTFGRVIDDPPTSSYGMHDGLNLVGDGNMSLPDRYSRFSDILHIDPLVLLNCTSSLCRLFSDLDPTTPFFEWIPNAIIPTGSKQDFTVQATGLGIKSIWGYARTEAFDWDGTDAFLSRDPDWLYGGDNKARNGSLEEEPLGIANPGFEDGTREPWWPGAVEGVSANAQVQTVIVDTGTYALEVDPLLAEGGTSTTFRVIPSKTYVITARIRGALGVDYQLGASGPDGIIPLAGAVLAEAFGTGTYNTGQRFEAQTLFVGTGAFATITLSFQAAADQTVTQLSLREGEAVLNGALFYLDVVSVVGYGIGTDPWQPTNVEEVTVFQASNTQAFDGLWSLQLTAADGHGTMQRFQNILPGVTYTATVAIGFTDVASTWALEARDVQGNLIGQASATIGVAAFTPLSITFKVPDFLPGATGEIVIAAINYSGATRSAFVDALVFYRGNLPTTIGAILGDLYADATADHAAAPTLRVVWEDEANPGTAYLTLDFDDALDSGGVAWLHPEISIKIWMRMNYLQVMDQFSRGWGYEWRIVPDDVELGTWLLQVYNPGTMLTDYTAAATPAIQGGSQDVRRSVARFLPNGTDNLVEGLERVTARDRLTDLLTALGRIEASRLDRELPSLDAVVDAAMEDNTGSLVDTLTLSYTLVNPTDLPLTAYLIGDLLTVHDPPDVDIPGRLVDVVLTVTPDGVEWDTDWSPQIIEVS